MCVWALARALLPKYIAIEYDNKNAVSDLKWNEKKVIIINSNKAKFKIKKKCFIETTTIASASLLSCNQKKTNPTKYEVKENESNERRKIKKRMCNSPSSIGINHNGKIINRFMITAQCFIFEKDRFECGNVTKRLRTI